MTIDSKYKILKSFFTCFALLPLGVLYLFSDMAYFIVYYVIGYRRKTVRHNLELVFGTSDRKRLGRNRRSERIQAEEGIYNSLWLFCTCEYR